MGAPHPALPAPSPNAAQVLQAVQMDQGVTPGSRGPGQGWPMDRELWLRVTGNYFKSLLKTVPASPAQRAPPVGCTARSADTLACTHERSHARAASTRTHTRMGMYRVHADPKDMGTVCVQGADAQRGLTRVTSPQPLGGASLYSPLPPLCPVPSTDQLVSFGSPLPDLGPRGPELNQRMSYSIQPQSRGGGWRKRGERSGGGSGGGDCCWAVILSNCCFAER